jgi:hypothetical protein
MQYVKDIDLREWNKLIAAGKLTDKQQSFFERKWKNNPGNRGGYWTFEFKKPWVFEMKRQPHYITHRILIDPKLESELTELSNRIERQNLTPKISKIMGWKYGWKDFYDRKKMIIENETDKLLKEELVGFTERYED